MKIYRINPVYEMIVALTLLLAFFLGNPLLAQSDEDGGRPADTNKGWSTMETPGDKGSEATIYSKKDFVYDENHFGLDLEGKRDLIDRFQWRLSMWTSYNYFNNSDLRGINDENETSIRQTDDKMQAIVAGAEYDIFLPVNEYLDVRIDIWKTGLWGHDQLGGRDNNNDSRETRSGSNTVNFGKIFTDIHFQPGPKRYSKLDLRFGRQPLSIGGAIENDFYFDDTIDALVIKWYGDYGRLDLLLLDVYSSGSPIDDVNFIQYISHDSEKVDGFNGDVNSYRQGLTYRFPVIGDSDLGGTHLDIRAFYYYAKYGGTNDGGSDRSNEGTSGNFPDYDFSFMKGARINIGWENWFSTSITYAESNGLDRQQLNEFLLPLLDMDNNGKSWHLEFLFAMFNDRFRFRPSYYFADGGRYYMDGVQYSHGFVSLKGDQVGGILMNMNWGLHPSAYTDDDGIDDSPYERARKSGSEIKHLGFSFGIMYNLYLKLDWWRLSDTNQVSFLHKRKKAFDNLFGKEENDYFMQNILLNELIHRYPQQATLLSAHRRFGAPLGEEINLGLDWDVRINWKIWATAGVFYPMRYFSTPGLQQETPQGNAKFTGFQLGMLLKI